MVFFFCLFDCLHSFRTKNKLESHKNVYENIDLCNHYQKSNKASFIVYADLL